MKLYAGDWIDSEYVGDGPNDLAMECIHMAFRAFFKDKPYHLSAMWLGPETKKNPGRRWLGFQATDGASNGRDMRVVRRQPRWGNSTNEVEARRIARLKA